MSEHTFTLWLHQEISSARCALLTLYERRDKLRYSDRVQLEQEYMNKVGTFEEKVIREEIEVELLQKKQQMIQTAINRREPVDEAAIDAQIQKLREQMTKDAAGPTPPDALTNLNEEQNAELQRLYSEIVHNYHPQMHPELTEAQKALFVKAQDAYRRRDLAALKLIDELLKSTNGDMLDPEALMAMLKGFEIEFSNEPQLRDYSTDYALAAKLYPFFTSTAEEAAIQEEWDRYKRESDEVMAQMEKIQSDFPFTAAEMLADPEKVAAYKKDLELRMMQAFAARNRLTEEIRAMIERAKAYE